MTNTTTKKPSRSEELTQALRSVEAELDTARTRLGECVADDNVGGAKEARAEVERLERVAAELRSAVPIAQRREAEARQAERERQRRAAEREANRNRKQRLAAAKKVDAALRALGRAFDAYLSTEVGGGPGDAGRAARRARHAIAAATFHAAPGYANAIEPKRRPMRAHHEPLADAVEKTVREFAEVEDE